MIFAGFCRFPTLGSGVRIVSGFLQSGLLIFDVFCLFCEKFAEIKGRAKDLGERGQRKEHQTAQSRNRINA